MARLLLVLLLTAVAQGARTKNHAALPSFVLPAY